MSNYTRKCQITRYRLKNADLEHFNQKEKQNDGK